MRILAAAAFLCLACTATKSTFPARRLCRNRGYFYDVDLEACVFIDSKKPDMPVFDKCPLGTTLQGRTCVGTVTSEKELHCPHQYRPNIHEQCIHAVAYVPDRGQCPSGFEYRQVGPANSRVCVKEKWDEPISVTPSNDTKVAPTVCPGHWCKKPEPIPPTMGCADGGRLEINPKTKKTGCFWRVIVPPRVEDLCNDGYHFSAALASCHRIRLAQAKFRCPQPTPKLGPGFGDWDTPEYHVSAEFECAAKAQLAKNPRCRPDHILEGPMLERMCYPRRIKPYEYDCGNMEGYTFSIEDGEGICSFTHNDAVVGLPGYQTLRESVDGWRIRRKQKPREVRDAAVPV